MYGLVRSNTSIIMHISPDLCIKKKFLWPDGMAIMNQFRYWDVDE